MNFNRETSIEKIIRENTPDFVVGTSYFIEKYHSFKWQCPVHFSKGIYVSKGVANGNGGYELKQLDMAYPDFVLLNGKQCNTLDKAIYNADNGLEYISPFLMKNGWYIEAFGDYWHSKAITGVDESEHERQVVEAYEKSGNHVLILWEHDILNHWYEVCEPKINDFLVQFRRNVEYDESYRLVESPRVLSDDAICCLNDRDYYKSIGNKEEIVNELCDFYHSSIKPFYNKNMIEIDWKNVKRKYEESSVYPYSCSMDGKILLDYFVRSRLDECFKDSRSINSIWSDKTLMKKAIQKCLSSGKKVLNSNVVILEMIEGNGYRVPDDVLLWNCLGRVKRFSKKGGIFFDPCAGYGERLLTSCLLGMKYVGIVSDSRRLEELRALSSYIGYDVELACADSSDENVFNGILDGRKIDLCVTSILFTDEKHTVDWIAKTLVNCNRNMNDNGAFIVYVPHGFDWSNVMGVQINNMGYYSLDGKTGQECYSIGKACCVEGDDYVKCAICGECMNHLANHIVKVHGMSIDEYKSKYGDVIISKSSIEARVDANKKKYLGIENHHYGKRVVYLLPDGTYASKSDKYKRAWGFDEVKPEHVIDASTVDYVPDYAKRFVGEEGIDYVKCAICGAKKGNLTQHIKKKHGMTVSEYESAYNSPVHSKKSKEAFHDAALRKWQTQFANGTSTPSKQRVQSDYTLNKKRDNMSQDEIGRMLNEGYTQIEMCRELNCSDVTLRKWMGKYGLKMPSRTITYIRKAVKNGAQLNLEKASYDNVLKMVSDFGIEKTMDMFGVKRTVFESWMSERRNVEEIHEEPKSDSSGQLLLFGEPSVESMVDEIPYGLDDTGIIGFLKSHGFPYPKIENYDCRKIVHSIINNKSVFDENGEIGIGNSAGNDALLAFFPNFYETHQHGKKSAMWHFENNLEHILNDIRKHSNRYPTLALVRSYLVEHERVSGFRPTVAKQIYDKYCPENAIVLDPCGGWGGRMLGAYCSDRVKRYDCIDACKKTCEGLERVKDAFGKIVMGKDVNVKFGAFEDVCVADEFYDFVFTSTPYFIKEHYSDDEEESCNRYEKYEEWRNGFLKPFVEKSFKCLKNGGVFVVNIDDVIINHKKYDLCDDLKKLAEGTGFVFKEMLFMKSRNRYVGTQSGEPIFLMVKEAK